jgi:hypothetical protein
MTDEDPEEQIPELAEVRKLIDDPKEDQTFWETRPYYSAAQPDDRRFNFRESQLARDLQIFRDALRRLRAWGRETMPGVCFENGSLPSDPRNLNLTLSNDPISASLRGAWAAHRERRESPFSGHPKHVSDGSVIEMPLQDSTKAFSDGLASALVSAAVGSATGLVDFTVNSQNKRYRVYICHSFDGKGVANRKDAPPCLASNESQPSTSNLESGTSLSTAQNAARV